MKREARTLEKQRKKLEKAIGFNAGIASQALRYDETGWEQKAINIEDIPKQLPDGSTEGYMRCVGEKAISLYEGRTGITIHYDHDASVIRTMQKNPIDLDKPQNYPDGIRLVFSRIPPMPATPAEPPVLPNSLPH